MDALVEREYENIISDCKKKLDNCNLNANWFLPFVFTFLMDDGIFNWTLEQKNQELQALAMILEKSLHAKEGSFSFFYKQ